MSAAQEHADQAGTPAGVGAAQIQGFVRKVCCPGHGRMAGVRRSDRVLAVDAKAVQQVTHGARHQVEGLRDRRHALTLVRPLLDHLTQGQRNGMWHEQSSLEQVFNHETHGTLFLGFAGANPS